MGNCFCINSTNENFKDKKFDNTKIFNLVDKKLHGKIVDIYDGDTCTCILNVFGDFYKFKIRLADIDTCEMTSTSPKLKKKAIQAKNRLFNLVTKSASIIEDKKEMRNELNKGNYIVKILCGDFDKYGRLLAWIFDKDSDSNSLDKSKSYNHILINEKLAYLYHGDTKLSEKEQIKNLLA